jgi:hypothetical protein
MVLDGKEKKTSVLYVKNLYIIKNRDFFMGVRPTSRFGFTRFLIAFRLDSILIKQKNHQEDIFPGKNGQNSQF